jgi:Bifunctional DNA primase/polymerase, N-terminal
MMLDAALDYAARGHPVFPLERGGKKPLGLLAPHGLKEATSDADKIRAWCTAEPNANIGLRTGLHFDVLDIDGPEGWQSLAHAVAENGCLSSSPVALTPRGGAHYYFAPTGIGNRAGFLPGLDWRGVGGYVVAPPSIGSNGVLYEWAICPDEQTLEPAPSWLVTFVTRTTVSNARHTGKRNTSSNYGRRALEGEAGRVILAPEGSRNHELNTAAFSCGQLVIKGDLDAETVADALYGAAIRAGLDHKEIVDTIRSGLAAGAANPRRS